MSDEITPALTADEWKGDGFASHEIFPGVVVVDDDVATTVEVNGGEKTLSFIGHQRHAVAALCLHQQPFGFTAYEATLLSEIAKEYPELQPIAAKVAALLPPEPR